MPHAACRMSICRMRHEAGARARARSQRPHPFHHRPLYPVLPLGILKMLIVCVNVIFFFIESVREKNCVFEVFGYSVDLWSRTEISLQSREMNASKRAVYKDWRVFGMSKMISIRLDLSFANVLIQAPALIIFSAYTLSTTLNAFL